MNQHDVEARNWARERNLNRAQEEWRAGRTNKALEFFAASSASPSFFRIKIGHLTTGLEALEENESFFLEDLPRRGWHSDEEAIAIAAKLENLKGMLEEITGLPKGEMVGKELSLDTRNTYQYLIDQLSILAANAGS